MVIKNFRLFTIKFIDYRQVKRCTPITLLFLIYTLNFLFVFIITINFTINIIINTITKRVRSQSFEKHISRFLVYKIRNVGSV